MRRTDTTRRHRARGTTLVETALVLSLLLLFLLGIFEYGRYLLITQLLSNAARDGVRYAATNVDKSSTFVTTDELGKTNITDYVKQESKGAHSLISGFAVSVFPCDATTMYQDPPVIQPKASYTSWNQATFTERLGLRITGTYRPVLPVVFLPGSGINVSFFGSGSTVPISITAASNTEG